MNRTKPGIIQALPVTAGCILLMGILQAGRMATETLAERAMPALSGKMRTMCAMLLLWFLMVVYIRLRQVKIPVFPQRFSVFYSIVTAVAAVLLIATPSNYTVGVTAILEMIYGSIVTPVFEETIFRGYIWERLRGVYKSEKAVFISTTLLFSLWHLGYMLTQLQTGNWFAVGTKLAAGLVYGLILGLVRMKCRNLYLPVLVHGVLNLFMV